MTPETLPPIGSVVEITATGHRGRIVHISAATSGSPVIFVSDTLQGPSERWQARPAAAEGVSLVLAAHEGPPLCLYCWAEVPADRLPQPRYPGGLTPPAMRSAAYCSEDHQKKDARAAARLRSGMFRSPKEMGTPYTSWKMPRV